MQLIYKKNSNSLDLRSHKVSNSQEMPSLKLGTSIANATSVLKLNKASIQVKEKSSKTPQQTAEDLVSHISKTHEIFSSFQEKEKKLIDTIYSLYSKKNTNPHVFFIQNHKEVLENFKEEAINADKKLVSLIDENKALKEKLALATLEEVDERIRKEKPSNRFVEQYAAKNNSSDRAKSLVSILGNNRYDDYIINQSKFDKEIENTIEKSEEPNMEQIAIALCQNISGEKRRAKKHETETKKIIRLKREVVLRLQEKIEYLLKHK
ncbi:hypothetical protein SteCoe_35148 [Stentor coeruleus]|uniref:Uncharacterized protein n=1 Tax=Stentor coeruleus TaxID=5963 RepID=A0A1R2AT39_9CILI|nr:hypothetical protein SteCoe_35148 [Stentor coeruleus]